MDFPNLLNNLDPEIESDEGIIYLIVEADFSLFFGSFDEHDWLNTDQFYSTFVPDLEFEDDEEELFVNQFLIADDDDLPVCSCPPGSPAVGFQEYDDDFMDDFPSFSVEETCHDPNNDTYDSNTNLPSPVTTIKLDYDFNRFSLQSPSLLTAGIPQIQVGNSWRRKGSSRTRLRIQRVKTNFANGPGGTLIPVTSIDTFAENPSRKSGRRRWWRNVNWEWNNDVSQYEITHQMVVFQSWTGASDKDFEIPTKHTVDEDGNPQTEIDVIKLHDIFRSSSRNRGTLEMNWTNLAAYLVDGNPHCGSHDYCTREYDGVDYSTLDVNGNLRFFFNFYYTDLSN